MTRFNAAKYWETRLRKSFDFAGVGRIGWGLHYNSWLYKVRRKVFLQLMSSCKVRFASCDVLDIGSGTGFYVDLWKELGARRVTGLDITDVAVTQLQQKYPKDIFHRVDIGGDIDKIRKLSFDVISCLDVLFHIVDDGRYQKALENIYALTKPGGLFVFSDFLPQGKTRRLDHIVFRSIRQVGKAVRQAGFEPIVCRPMFVLMSEPVDGKDPFLEIFWTVFRRILRKVPFAGLIAGGMLYPLELKLVSKRKRSPSIEIVLCRKPKRIGGEP